MKKILIGTHNKGKFKEIAYLLSKKYHKISPITLKIPSPKETGKSFVSNSKLKAKIGDNLLLMANSVYGSIEAIDVKIVGLSKTYSQFDSMGLFLRNQDAKDLLVTDSFHSVVVLLQKRANETNVVKQLNNMFKEKNIPLKALSFEQIATFFF